MAVPPRASNDEPGSAAVDRHPLVADPFVAALPARGGWLPKPPTRARDALASNGEDAHFDRPAT